MLVSGFLNVASVQFITIGMLAKAYAHLSGLRDDPVIAWFYRHFTIEKAGLAFIPLLFVGAVILVSVIFKWASQGFGNLDAAKPLFFGTMCMLNGIQVALASYLFSIMALPRHIDQLPVQSMDTGIKDV